MKSNIAWIAAAAGIAVAAYFALNTPAPQHATGSDSIEDAARGTANWGSKTRLRGAGGRLLGKLKQGVADVTGNANLADDAAADRVAGAVQGAAGELAQAAGQTLHDFNR